MFWIIMLIIGCSPFTRGTQAPIIGNLLSKLFMSRNEGSTQSINKSSDLSLDINHATMQRINNSFELDNSNEQISTDHNFKFKFKENFVNILCTYKEPKAIIPQNSSEHILDTLNNCDTGLQTQCDQSAIEFHSSTHSSILCRKHGILNSAVCIQNLLSDCKTPFEVDLDVNNLFQTDLITDGRNQSLVFINIEEIKNVPVLTVRSQLLERTSHQCELVLNNTGVRNYAIRMRYGNQSAILVRGFEERNTIVQKIGQMPDTFQIEVIIKMKTANHVQIKDVQLRNCHEWGNSTRDQRFHPYRKCSFTHGLCYWLLVNNINDTCHFAVLTGLDVAKTRQKALLDNTDSSFVGKVMYLHGRSCYGKRSSFRTIPFNYTPKGDNSTCKVTFSTIGTLPLRVFIVYPSHNKMISLWNQSVIFEEWTSTELTLTDYIGPSVFYFLFDTNISQDKYRDYVAVDDIMFSEGCQFEEPLDIQLMQIGVKNSTDALDVIIPVIVGSSFLAMTLAGIAVVTKIYGRNSVMRKGRTWSRMPVKWTCLDAAVDVIPPSVNISNFCNIEEFLTRKNPNYEWYNGRLLNNKLTDIPRDKLTISNKIGNGAFGEVYSGIILQDYPVKKCRHVAVKTVLQGSSERARVDFFLEALTLSKFSHPNIVEFLGVSVEKTSLLLVLEYMPGGDLKTYLRSLRSGKFDDIDISCTAMLDMCIDVASACKYLEEIKFVHRDIAARNCLLSSKRKDIIVKIADFGLARDILSSEYYRKTGTAMLPVRWMSPESFTEGMFSSKSDVWSFGVLMWEIFSYAQMPYEGYSNTNVITLILTGKRLFKPALCKSKVYDIMCLCWKTNPVDRPSFSELLSHLETVKKLQQNEIQRSPRIHVRQKRLNSYICDHLETIPLTTTTR